MGMVFLFSIAKFANEETDGKGKHSTLYNKLLNYLKSELVMEKPLPSALAEQRPGTTTLIYVLGGNQDTLLHRFRKAASLYHQGLSGKILILNRPGITEYSPELGRNLTNNEWAIREFEELNVEKEDIEPVSVPKWFFGTLSEAREVSDIAREKGCNRLILVSSAYHTRRVFTTFSKLGSNRSPEYFIYGSDDVTGLQGLLSEYVKLFLYDNFAIPASVGKK
jgi:uncharacterized SAM-binding protein YcdF (DUF218 family)